MPYTFFIGLLGWTKMKQREVWMGFDTFISVKQFLFLQFLFYHCLSVCLRHFVSYKKINLNLRNMLNLVFNVSSMLLRHAHVFITSGANVMIFPHNMWSSLKLKITTLFTKLTKQKLEVLIKTTPSRFSYPATRKVFADAQMLVI